MLQKIVCFHCRQHITRCRCAWLPAQSDWVSEYRKVISSVSRSGAMKFEFNGDTFAIDFQRNYVIVKQYDRFQGEIEKRATKPHTTVIILKLDPKEKGIKNSEIVATATVGCYYKDTYTPEDGRLFALRALCRQAAKDPASKLSKEMRSLIWKTYNDRLNQPQPTPVAEVSSNVIEGHIVS